MRVFLAGASGVIGRPLVRLLVEVGHEVTGLTRGRGVDAIRAAGAAAVTGDALDRAALGTLVAAAKPEVVINQLTAIPARINPRTIGTAFRMTNRLRDEGTRNLIEAAIAAGARRVVSQSVAFAYAAAGGDLAVESDPLFEHAPPAFRPVVQAVQACERRTLGTPDIDGVVLRFGYLYGPGTAYARDGAVAADVLQRRLPIVGRGAGVLSFVHTGDAARATLRALEAPAGATFNVVDDEPVPVREWLPEYARLLGAPAPRRIPAWLGRLAAGAYGVHMMTRQRGASNAAARARLGWEPLYATWRTGFARELESP